MHTAIILDGDLKSALTVVRSLGRVGVLTLVGATRGSGMALHSRCATETFVYPDPKTDRADFLETLRHFAVEQHEITGDKPVVFCFSDATHASVANAGAELRDVILFPKNNAEAFATAFNKQKTAALAERLGITTSVTYEPAEADALRYPVVIKPAASVSWRGQRGVFGSAEFVFSAEELQHCVEAYDQSGQVPVIQQVVTGEEFGVELLAQEGEVIAHFAHRRVRSFSPTGGAAVVKETAAANSQLDQMKQWSFRLVHELSWTGPMMVEWKLDRETKTPVLIETNGRFWGSLPLPVMAGIDFPVLYYELMCGRPAPKPVALAPAALRTRHFWGDVRWLLHVWFDRSPLRATHYPGRFRAAVTFLFEPFRSRGDVWSWRDPKPAFFELIDILRR